MRVALSVLCLSVGRGFETHPAHWSEVQEYLGFRLFVVSELGAKRGLWDPKRDPKNSGCLAGTQWMWAVRTPVFETGRGCIARYL